MWKYSFVKLADAIMSFFSNRISLGFPVEPEVCPITSSFSLYHSCKKAMTSGSIFPGSMFKSVYRVPFNLMFMAFKTKWGINPSLPVGCAGWSSRFAPREKEYYSCRVAQSPSLEVYPWGDTPKYKLSIVRWHSTRYWIPMRK